MISRLVAKSCPNASARRFPSGDSIDQPGVDGFLRDENGFPPFVPSGDSYWEIGIGPAARKATNDYEKRTRDIPANVRRNSTLVLVNPRSSVKEWRNARKGGAQRSWIEEREKRKEWKAIKLIDGTIIADWLLEHPDVGRWVAENTVGLPKHHIETVDQHWKLLQSYGSPNPLTPELFLGNRINAIQHLRELLHGDSNELKLLTRFPDQVADFVCAFIASSEEEEDQIRFSSRALIISDPKVWSALCDIYEGTRLILIADSSLDLSGESASRMIQKALVSGHSAIYDAPYGGPNEDLTLRLQDPRTNDIYRALTSVGYSDHQARDITNKSGRNLNQVLRMLRNDTLQPQWARGEGSDDLVFALLAGAWQHSSQADRKIIQILTGKNYIEWTRTIRKAVGFRNPPVVDRNGWWKFIPRFEGWHSLGRILDEEHLHKLHEAFNVTLRSHIVHSELADAESSRTLETNEFRISSELKKGLSESLALMGSFPDVSDLLTQKQIEEFVGRTVRHALSNFDGEDWRTLHELLPFLAEASPADFLDTLLDSVKRKESLFAGLAFPVTALTSESAYPYGLIWAIESIAWSEEYLPRACMLLGKLSELVKEPENANQPLRSLVRILFPLLPQTNASSQHRMDVVRVLLHETPITGWNLLLELFPHLSGTVTVNYRPVWRKLFPDNWEPAIASQRDFIYQIETLSGLVVDLASEDYEKLNDERFIELFPDLSPSAFKRIMCHLASDSIIERPDAERLDLWKHLTSFYKKHRRFPGARWSLNEIEVSEIETIVEKLAPKDSTIVSRLVFSNDVFLLINDSDDWDLNAKERDSLRIQTMKGLLESNGVEKVIDLAEDVEDSDDFGFYLAKFANPVMDQLLLPGKLGQDAAEKPTGFIEKYVGHRWYLQGWEWVDGLDRSIWTPFQIGTFLGWMPFATETWERVIDWLADDEHEYWTRTHAHLPRDFQGSPDLAIEKLIFYNRGLAAIECLADLQRREIPFDHVLACKALLGTDPVSRRPLESTGYILSQIIKKLQSDSSLPVETLLEIEWKHFDLFDSHFDVGPNTIENELSTNPNYFYRVVEIYHRLKSLMSNSEAHVNQNELDIRNHANFMFGHHWRKLPGIDSNGDFQPEVFEEWLNEVYRLCATPELIEEAQDFLGESLIYAPADPDGLWIHRTVARTLNDTNAQTMRYSYFIAVLNSRGVYRVEGTGIHERQLAEKYRKKSERLKEAGFHRFASTLLSVSLSYAAEADDAIGRDELEN